MQALGKITVAVPQKLKKKSTVGPPIPLFGIYPEDSITYYRDPCSSMFIAPVFTIGRKQKQPIN